MTPSRSFRTVSANSSAGSETSTSAAEWALKPSCEFGSPVSAGGGVIEPEHDSNDYQSSIRVTGKIVVRLAGKPRSDAPGYFAGDAPAMHSHPDEKQKVAIARGARGTIPVPNSRDEGAQDWNRWPAGFAFEDFVLAYQITGGLSV